MLYALCPVPLGLAILSRPGVGDVSPVRRETILIGRTVGINLCGNIKDDGFLFTDALPSVIDAVGHLNQQGMMDPDKELVDLSPCW